MRPGASTALAIVTALTSLLSGSSPTYGDESVDYGWLRSKQSAGTDPWTFGPAVPDERIYSTYLLNPNVYCATVPDGTYRVRLHLIAGDIPMEVDLEGRTVLDGLKVGTLVPPKKGQSNEKADGESTRPTPAAALVKEARVVVSDGLLNISLIRLEKSTVALFGLEVLGVQSDFSLHINCGSDAACTDAAGIVWQPDRKLPFFPRTSIALDPRPDAKGKWVRIDLEFMEKLRKKGILGFHLFGGANVDPGTMVNQVICNSHGQCFVPIIGIGLWKYTGPGGTLESIEDNHYNAMCNLPTTAGVDPAGERIYVFGIYGAISKTEDGGKTWSPLFRGLGAGPDMCNLDWSVKEPKLMAAGMHDAWRAGKGHDPFVSTDGGLAWTSVADELPIRGVAFGAVEPSTILVGKVIRRPNRWQWGGMNDKERAAWHEEQRPLRKHTGLFRSTDTGRTWTRVSDLVPPYATWYSSHIAGYQGKLYYNTQKGLAISTDKGLTWRLMSGSPSFTTTILFGKTPDHLVGVDDNTGFYESTDGGKSWNLVAALPQAETEPEDLAPYLGTSWDPVQSAFYCRARSGGVFRYQR